MTTAGNTRAHQIRLIHIAKAKLGLDDRQYRAELMAASADADGIGGIDSSANMTDEQRARVLMRFREMGWRDTGKRQGGKKRWPGEPKDCDSRPMLGKVRALLADAKRPWKYAHAMAKRMFGAARVEWLRDEQLHKLIAALEVDARRKAK